jgi:hypothetical protein
MVRMNFFGAWMAVLAAEMVGLRSGLGAMIIIGREQFNNELILIGIVVIGLCGFLVDTVLVQIQRRILWWRCSGTKTRYSGPRRPYSGVCVRQKEIRTRSSFWPPTCAKGFPRWGRLWERPPPTKS